MPCRILAIAVVLLLSACTEVPRDLTIADFERALAAAGISVEDREPYLHFRIDAMDGRGLRAGGGMVEVYEFDLCMGAARQAIRRFHADGIMGRETLRRRNLLLVAREEHPQWERVEQVFRSLETVP